MPNVIINLKKKKINLIRVNIAKSEIEFVLRNQNWMLNIWMNCIKAMKDRKRESDHEPEEAMANTSPQSFPSLQITISPQSVSVSLLSRMLWGRKWGLYKVDNENFAFVLPRIVIIIKERVKPLSWKLPGIIRTMLSIILWRLLGLLWWKKIFSFLRFLVLGLWIRRGGGFFF